ncbi:MAG: hypothetical protein MJA27_22640 [Pseudanabaenales cyanobacterium]|nr:hypothetical protein [Pseudanabaenales cyanobacterium]
MEHLSIEMQGECSPQTLFEVLLRAASHHDSIEHTSEVLDGTPTGNGIRHHLGSVHKTVLDRAKTPDFPFKNQDLHKNLNIPSPQ